MSASSPVVVPIIPQASVLPIGEGGAFTLPWRKYFQYLSSLQVTPADIAALTLLINEALADAANAITIADAALADTTSRPAVMALISMGF